MSNVLGVIPGVPRCTGIQNNATCNCAPEMKSNSTCTFCHAFLALGGIGKVWFLLKTSKPVSKVRSSEACQVLYARPDWGCFTLANWLEDSIEGPLFQPRANMTHMHMLFDFSSDGTQ